MPEDAQFVQATQEDLITDEAEIAAAQLGPDIHCPYCGTRNVANAAKCVQCGGDLSEGTARQVGQVLGAHSDGSVQPITCPACGNSNHPDAAHCTQCGAPMHGAAAPPPDGDTITTPPKKGCSKGVLFLLAAAALLAVVIGVISCWPRSTSAAVTSVSWTRTIPILEQRQVERSDWEENIPDGAELYGCEMREYGYSDGPQPNSTKECGTPYSRDLGNGRVEVVQDCEYLVYREYCRYSVLEWVVVNTLQAEGRDYSPSWPRAQLASGQREGDRTEQYVIVFGDANKQYVYTTSNAGELAQFQPGTRWSLKVSGTRVISYRAE